jgi:hypothetical protein
MTKPPRVLKAFSSSPGSSPWISRTAFRRSIGHAAIDQPRAIFAHDNIVLLRGIRTRQIADDRGQHVGQRHQTLQAAVLVHHQRALLTRSPEGLEQLLSSSRWQVHRAPA